MKKGILLFLAVIMWSMSWAQVAGYSFAAISGTYTAITGGTMLRNGTNTLDSWASTAQTIPAFTFNSVSYTTAFVTSNGILTLGGSAPSAFTSGGIGTTTGSGIAICPFSADLDRATTTATTEMRWQTVGNEVIFQWQQFKRYGQTESFDFQIRLNTVTGVVVFVYQLNSGPGPGTTYPQVGIRTSATDFKNITITDVAGTPTWAAPSAGSVNTATCRFTSAVNAKSFASGQTYTWTPPTCFTPTAVTSSAVTTTSATISWTAASPAPSNGYQYEVRTSGAAGSGATGLAASGSVGAGVVTANISGLSATTTYSVYVRSYCGGSDYSAWTSAYTFTTPCNAISSFPWTENFDGVTIPAFPSCWLKQGTGDWVTTNNANSTYDADARSGTQFLRESWTATNEYMWTPGFTLTAGTSYDFSFWWAGDTYTGWTGDIFYNSSQSSTGATQMGASFVVNTTTTTKTYAQALRSFTPSSTGTYYFAIRVNANATPYYLSYDDFRLEPTPSCVTPTAVTSSAVTATTATISWTAASPAPANGYQYEVRASGAAGSGATGLADSGSVGAGVVTDNVNGLSANTTYSVYVRSDCGGSSYSAWTSAYTFTTPCAASSVPYTEGFEGLSVANTLPSCMLASPVVAASGKTQTYIAAATGTNSALIARTGTKFAAVYWSPSASSGYFFSVPLQLTAGVSYTASVFYKTDGVAWTDATLYYGTAATPAGMTNTIATVANAAATTYTEITGAFTPASSGTYFVAFRGYNSTTAPNYIAFDDFSVVLSPTCITPTAVTSSAVTATTATISWTAASPAPSNGYEYEVRTSGAAGSGVTGLTDSGSVGAGVVTDNVSGLSANTTYSVYVRSYCGGSDYSAWTSAYTFTTGCDPYTVLPHTEPFATYLPSTCWSEGDLGNLTTGPTTISATASSWTEDGFLNSVATGAVKINIDATGDNDWLLSPQFTLPATPYQRLKYSVGATQWNATTAPTNAWEADDYVEVLISTNGATNWTVLKTYNSSNVPSHLGQIDLIDLNTYAGQTIKIAFRGVEGAANGSADIDFFIDNFIIEEMPSCVEPSALAASTITYTSATISWTSPAVGTPLGYEYEVRTSGAAGSGATGLVTNGTTLVPTVSSAITGLTGATTYYYYVRTDCGASNYSAWASSNFNTLSCNVPTAVTSSAITTTTATISWTAPAIGTPAGYEYEVRTSGAAGSGATGLVTSGTTTSPTVSANITGLVSSTTYSIYVRSTCSAGFYSAWTAAVTFSTSCGTATIPYSQNFETATVPAIPICNSIQNAGTGNNWVTASAPGSGFASKTLKYGWNTTNNANAWFYTQGIQMTAGTSYRITFRYGNNSVTFVEKLKVAVGASPVNTSMTTTLLDFPNINQNAVQNATYDFTVPSTGIYYFGFNCYSALDQFNLYVDDILVDLTPQWTGNVSSDWNTAGNWSAGSVPVAATNVLIPSTYTNPPIVNEDKTTPAICNNLTIESGAVLTVAADKGLTVNGNTINNGTIEIESTVTGDGSLITTGTISGTGIYNVDRYLQESMWHLVTSPITNAQSGVMLGIWLRPYDEATNTFGAYIVPENIPMTTGQGFSVWTNTANEIRTFAGTVNDGAQGPWSVQLTGSASANTGWNLIGNPYPSAIDWNAASGWTKNSIGGTIYLWNQTQYATFNGTVGTNQGSRYIAMGQGFFVQASAPGANISLNDNVRVHDAIRFRDEVEVPDVIRINVEGNSSADEAVIYHVDGSDDSYDFNYDATKLYGNSSAPQLYTMKQDNMLAINSMSNLQNLDGKLVYLEVGEVGEYMITYDHNLIEYSNVMMKDLATNTVIYPNHNYIFSAQPDDDAARFEFFFDLTGITPDNTQSISVWAFNNILNVEVPQNETINSISLFDMQGKLIMTFTDRVKDLSGLAPAIYVVKVNAGEKTVVEKVIVK